MKPYTPKTFALGTLAGVSAKNVEEHLKLYAGYVTSANLIQEKLHELAQEATPQAYLMGELRRRFAFEFNGMRNHEYYFEQFEGEAKPLDESTEFAKKIIDRYGSYGGFLNIFEATAMTRGVGWAFLVYDQKHDDLRVTWIEEQHLGHLLGTVPLLALDMWEHAYVYDYPTSEKKKYITAFFQNLNWDVVVKRFEKCA